MFSSLAVRKIKNALLWRLPGRTRCCIATFSNLIRAVAVVDLKVTKVRENFVKMSTTGWLLSFRKYF